MQQEIARLKEKIETLVGIGTYKFPNGQTVKAVSVATPDHPPAGTVTQGLEIAIVPGIEMDVSPALNRGCFWKISHEIILKQWNDRDTTLGFILPLVQLLESDYSVKVGLRILPNPKLQNIETRKLTISKTLAKRRTN
jgi:hypothetical protein